jgi:hypothetical protein
LAPFRIHGDSVNFGSHEFPSAAISEKKGLSFRFCQEEIDWMEKRVITGILGGREK